MTPALTRSAIDTLQAIVDRIGIWHFDDTAQGIVDMSTGYVILAVRTEEWSQAVIALATIREAGLDPFEVIHDPDHLRMDRALGRAFRDLYASWTDGDECIGSLSQAPDSASDRLQAFYDIFNRNGLDIA